ncbi:protein broad-minded [Brienomyrus brachyistius]|uniref:protein broad-minded n=1 Tax=Brienomyrus brachyistius TaxID=42636 RepID=UPI0020B370B9|nr:protein broad-minded [Brienomyrus brachyistius]XP_048841120.1 protein broad-minded [Brienomyrus brachyistius]XP_048841121.1 protein broad-minded [Brienomyrus brachyistius]XP_048841122.1 protein broad-minded [Brienomyrus brachyistius]
MSQLSAEDEAELETLLRRMLKSVKERIRGAPSVECAEELLLHLEETDQNFHNYELVKYLRRYIDGALGMVIEEETEGCARMEGQAIAWGQDTQVHDVTRRARDSAEYKHMMQTLKNTMMVVVESLINKFEEDQLKKEEMHRRSHREQLDGHYMDNCSDSDSSFSQSYGFMKQEQLQAVTGKLDQAQPKEVRREALQVLCAAPPSDVLACESWSSLRRSLSAALADPDPELSEKVLRFFAKTFSSSPLNITREIYTSLAKSLESDFLVQKLSFPSGSAVLDINRPEVARLLKQMRLLNDFQQEVPAFWIRHPEKYMEEIIESTLSLLAVQFEYSSGPQRTERFLEPGHLIALLDIRATWFKKWMHGYYSRTVVLRLLERKYRSLIGGAVQQCVHFQESRADIGGQVADMARVMGQQQIGAAQRTLYTARELEYAHFAHSLSVLGRLLMYAQGRRLFPIKVKKRKEPLSLMDLIVILIRTMYRDPKPQLGTLSHADALSPSSLVMEVLRTLGDRTDCADECLHCRDIVETLLSPVVASLRGTQVTVGPQDATLVHVADILARMAATERGLSLFLYDKGLVSADGESTSAAHVIVRFTQRLLACEWELGAAHVAGAFIFTCRQMYNTCEGLHALRAYGLHDCIARAWRKASSLVERIPTPVPGASPDPSSQEAQSILAWEETLLDSLLNFAATPKGFLLLQQTGAIHECVSYMFTRFTKKLQVSRCEKFGYGVMVTQVATTAPGIAALQSSGFVQAIVVDLWSALECGPEDVRVVQPRPTPMDPIDRSCRKSFLALVNLLYSSYAVWELLGQQQLPDKAQYSLREMPTSIIHLIDRLIMINSDAKIHSLFNYEQSHTFGLRLLSMMICSLDSLLLLESQYRVSEMLLQGQKDNTVAPSTGGEDFIIDGLSVERNHILVRMLAVGGPNERRLPPRALQKGNDPYPWKMFSSFPLPKCYFPEALKTPYTKQDSEMSAFLTSTTPADRDWMVCCRGMYSKVMTSKSGFVTENVLADLLEKTVLHLSASTADCFFPVAEVKDPTGVPVPAHSVAANSAACQSLSPLEQLGVQITLRYGEHLKLLDGDSEADLCFLVQSCRSLLSQQRAQGLSQLYCLREHFPGHDWFVSTVFLLLRGDGKRAWDLLRRLSGLLASAFLWPSRLHDSVHLPAEVAQSGIPLTYSCTAHYVEMLLKTEVPLVSSAFRMSGFTPSQICLQWLSQCFWNYLDWPEICQYVCTTVVMGADYQVYMCVAVLKHLQQPVLQHAQTQDLQVFLKEEPIQGFRVSDHLEYMEGLERRYRAMVLTDMKSVVSKAT